MYLINLHAVPKKGTEYFEKVVGAYVSVYIDYIDGEGAIQLAKYYTEQEGWLVQNVEDDFFEIEDPEELEKDYRDYYDEAKEYGYTMVFNCYESVEE
ncbi:hypothetical protein ACSIGC_06535 [Tenacibaculum sp. ZS6-P6]|uniref:hypothetical protein n=1 Tax=Tenacibaculum sp. ZS6-P6 TaxID=3447503 RepID=UPI003F9A9A58